MRVFGGGGSFLYDLCILEQFHLFVFQSVRQLLPSFGGHLFWNGKENSPKQTSSTTDCPTSVLLNLRAEISRIPFSFVCPRDNSLLKVPSQF